MIEYNVTNVSDERDKSIGSMIRTIRKASQMTQSDLAEKLNISIQQVHKYETGENSINALKLQDIANIFGCDVSVFYPKQHGEVRSIELLKIAERKSVFQDAKKKNNNDDAVLLLKSFFACKTKDRKKILDFVKKMAKQSD